MNLRIVLTVLIGLVGYGVWAFMAWADPAQRPDFLKFNIVMATGTIGLVLRDMPSGTPPKSPPESPPMPATVPTTVIKELS